MNKKLLAIFFAILSAGLYAINIPLSKLLLNYIAPTMMASYLYLGAGIGIGIVFLITKNKDKATYEKITKKGFARRFRNDCVRYISSYTTYTHDGSTHTHTIEHEHEHNHYLTYKRHQHVHKK